ncbi:helix-turn-helix transcriptional regulator [Clostridium minihomine]|uniref:helix-turn-helix transcriptional regulator n=1 Tax=Clostridium minihomine TaxID=2045012 RepID=UPI000C777433|nr:PAS domain-containing protein [Clostridium minihomine]
MEESSNIQLENLIATAQGIVQQFGSNCEVCIHDLNGEDLEHTIVYILNGNITGRKVGDGPSKIVLETIEALKTGHSLSGHKVHITRNKRGTILKSSSIFIKDINGNYRYMMGINFDITSLVSIDLGLSSLISLGEEKEQPTQIPTNVNDLLDNLIEQSIQLIGKPPALMNKEEKVQAIQFLNDAGAFLITKSGDKVSECFGISKFTLYSYIEVNKPNKNN